VWDRDPLLLGTPDGTVDLRTGAVVEPRAGDYITKSTAVGPVSGQPRLWLKFLYEALQGDEETIRYLQQWAGYCLTGLTSEHALAFLYGGGGNGKSVTIDRLVTVLGDYAVTAAMETFAVSKGERHSTELAMLRGARLVTASETEEGRAWNEARVKQMTGGDRITARFMRQDNFTFQPQFKLLIAGNHPPVLANVDDALRRRFNIVPFVSKPPSPDPYLSQKLASEDGKILQWMIDGCLDWQRHGLIRPTSVQDATTDYFDEQDVFGQWLTDRCEVDSGSLQLVEVSGKLFADWQQYAVDRGEPPGTQKSFAGALARRGVRRERRRFRGAPQRLFAGISLKRSFNSMA
jgi:putative DNA primase/helicase